VSAKLRMNSRSLSGLTLVTETPELDIMRLVPSRVLSPQISPAAHHTDATQDESISTSTLQETPERRSSRLKPEPERAFSPDPADQPGPDKGRLFMYSLGVTLPVTVFQQTERFFEGSRSHVQTQVPVRSYRIRVSRDVRGLVSYQVSISLLLSSHSRPQRNSNRGKRSKTENVQGLTAQPPTRVHNQQTRSIRNDCFPLTTRRVRYVSDGLRWVLRSLASASWIRSFLCCVTETLWWGKVRWGKVRSLKVRMAEGRGTKMG
jgi:hypothetical protein